MAGRINRVLKKIGGEHGDTEHLIKECYKSVTIVLQACYKSVTRVLQECYNRYTRVLQECYKIVTKLLRSVTTRSTAVFHCSQFRVLRNTEIPSSLTRFTSAPLKGCYKSVTRVLQECYKGVTRVSQGCHKGVT
jgi:hypothetical protein